MSAGDGYRYLIRTVAVGDGARDLSTSLTRYYTQSGNPPGRWVGAGLAGLDDGRGLAQGSIAGEEQMFRLFGLGTDPVSGAQLGSRPYRIAAGQGRGSVAGFDLTFSVPKSVSVWWALADADTQQEIVRAHTAAMHASLALLEREVAATRIGHNGVGQADVRGLIGAAFDHWDSRAGDPQLHTHLVIANRVQAADGAWRTLDSRALYRSVVAISETYNGLLADELTRRLGATWQPRTRVHSASPAWEIADVPAELMAAFSQRSQAIDTATNALIAAFRDQHGRAPSTAEMLDLRQQATLRTRPDKQLRSLAEMTDQWHERASAVLGMDPQTWAKGIGTDATDQLISADDATERAREIASAVLQAVQDKRSTWTHWNLHAEAARQLMGHRFATTTDRLAALDRVVDLACQGSVLLTAPALAPTPSAFQRADGTALFAHRHAEQYTSRALLDAEARLLTAGRDTTAPTVDDHVVLAALAAPPVGFRYPLGPSQADAVRAIATSGRMLDVLVGPAGTGKTVTLAGLRAAWETQHGTGSVIGLAPSATAADVLACELHIGTENTAKWLTETDHADARSSKIDEYRALALQVAARNRHLATVLQHRIDELTERVERWRLRPGQLLIIDEASLAGTLTLDRITDQARAAGAKVLLVGDWAQLSAIDAGGAFSLLVGDRATPPELAAVRRFTQRWEGAASRRLRVGDADAIASYTDHGRVHGGAADAMLDAAYQAWLTDEHAGNHALLIAGDTTTVAALNSRARADLVAAGQVAAVGVELANGQLAGVGDRIVTRRNDRTRSTGRGFVKNGDIWTITATGCDGSVTVRRPSGGPIITLPGEYVAEHVDLAYATTAYRAQGATVDTTHSVVSPASMTRETLYVAMTRGRHANTAYVVTDPVPDGCDVPIADEPATPQDVLLRVLSLTGADRSAHQTMRDEQDRATSIAQLADEYESIAAAAQQHRWERLMAASGLSETQIRDVLGSPAYGALTAALRHAEANRLPVESTLADLVSSRSLADADDLAAVLHERVTRWTNTHPVVADARMIAGLIPAAIGIEDPELHAALSTRADLMEQRATALVDRALADREPWIRGLGPSPCDPRRRDAWTRAARTLAAYRDRYRDAPPGREPSREERATTAAALQAALALARAEQSRQVPAGRQCPGPSHPIGI